MKVLIVHHLQPMWEIGLNEKGTSFEEMKEALIDYLSVENFDKIIFTLFEDYERMNYHSGLYGNFLFVEYGYGWWPEDYENAKETEYGYIENENIYIPVSNSYYCERWALINEDVKEWLPSKDDEVYICGAFEGECLADLESILQYSEIKYNMINELIA